jgi:hypothetical protein
LRFKIVNFSLQRAGTREVEVKLRREVVKFQATPN